MARFFSLDGRAGIYYISGALDGCPLKRNTKNAGVVELVDAADSKSAVRKDMSVRFRPPAPYLDYCFTPAQTSTKKFCHASSTNSFTSEGVDFLYRAMSIIWSTMSLGWQAFSIVPVLS